MGHGVAELPSSEVLLVGTTHWSGYDSSCTSQLLAAYYSLGAHAFSHSDSLELCFLGIASGVKEGILRASLL